MATFYSSETNNRSLTPAKKVSDVGQRGKIKVLRNTITLAAQASGSLFYLGDIPNGCRFKGISMCTDTSLGSSTIGIGVVGATYVDFKAAATFTATDTPTGYGKASARAAAAFTSDKAVYAIVGAATLPGSGTLSIDVEYIDVG